MAEIKEADVQGMPELGELSGLDQLTKQVQEASANAGAASAVAPTASFATPAAPVHTRKPVDEKTIAGIVSAKALITSKSEKLAGSPRAQARAIMLKASRVCGYTVHNDAKIDFATSKVKDTQFVDLVLKQSAPSAVNGFVVTYPQAPKAFIADDRSASVNGDLQKDVESLVNSQGATVVEIITKENMSNFMANYTGDYITESQDIFVPFIKKTRNGVVVYSDYENPELYVKTGGKVGIRRYAQISGLSEEKFVVRTSHSMRPRYIAPGNYIPERRFDTFCPVGRSYTAEEAVELNKLYFGKFFVVPKKNGQVGTKKYESFSTTSRKLLKYIDNLPTSEFFGDNAQATWADVKVPHWYNKNADGSPVMLTGKDILLVAKEFKKKADNTISERASLISRSLSAENAADTGAYKWNPEHPVVKATGGLLTYETYLKFADKRKSSAKTTAKSVQIGDIAGLTDEAIRDIFKSSLTQH